MSLLRLTGLTDHVLEDMDDYGMVDLIRRYGSVFTEAAIDHSFISERDSGIYNAMNKGALQAKGEYLLFLNAGVAENAIRPFVVGRKNWLFCDTPKGAQASAIVYTLVETAKANGLDPYSYLFLALTELPYLGKNPSQENLDAFMPWNAKIRNICSASKPRPPAGDL